MANEHITQIKRILSMVANTREQECDCSDVYGIMDEVAELKANGVDLTAIMPEIEHHLATCGCCHSEFKTLLKILEAE